MAIENVTTILLKYDNSTMFVEEENSYNIKSCTFVEYIIQKQKQ